MFRDFRITGKWLWPDIIFPNLEIGKWGTEGLNPPVHLESPASLEPLNPPPLHCTSYFPDFALLVPQHFPSWTFQLLSSRSISLSFSYSSLSFPSQVWPSSQGAEGWEKEVIPLIFLVTTMRMKRNECLHKLLSHASIFYLHSLMSFLQSSC